MRRLFILIFLCCITAMSVNGQTRNKNSSGKKKGGSYNSKAKKDDTFLNKQWWIGFKAGTNLSKAVVTTSYSVLSPSYDKSLISKNYESFNKAGTQAALEITFYFKGISLSIQPTYRHSRFVYTNYYSWASAGENENSTNRLELNYEQEQKVDHAVIPILAKYEFGTSRLRGYLQAGFFSAFLVNADKSIRIHGVDYASGGTDKFEEEPIIVGAKDLFAKNSWGLIGGGGLYYNMGNVRLNLDIMYHYGMSNISSAKNRFSNDRLTGVGDAMDNFTMNNILISAGVLFPLRFLESGFKSLDRK